jgi:hypothetical protein
MLVNLASCHTSESGAIKLNQNLDSFNRLRTSSPISQFEYQNEYNKGPLIWAEKVTGAGVATHQPNSSTVLLSTGGTTLGDGIIRQTIQYMRYAPGKSLLPIVTYNLKADQAPNYIKRVGYFDNLNGVFIELDGSVLSFVIRSYSTGVVVEERVSQKDWIIKRLNGEIMDDPKLDVSKVQISLTDVQWLGVGSVRCGFEINGEGFWAHIFHHANLDTTTYMSTANLPIRYEIHICSTVITEQGSIDDQGYYEHGINNGVAGKSIATRTAIISIRPKATFGGKINRGTIKHELFEIVAGTNNCLWELVYNPTLGGSPVWNSAGDNSLVEVDVAATTVTGGEIVSTGYALTGTGPNKGQSKASTQSKFPLGLDVDGGNPRVLSLVCTPFTGTAVVNASLGFKEYY